MNNLPTLYQVNSSGSVKEWSIRVENKSIITVYGQQNGKLIKRVQDITQGKNIGRKNETTPEGQAKLVAISKWKAKLDQGYAEQIILSTTPKNDEEDVPIRKIHPMLALDYFKRGKSIKFPCLVQPKLDGIRAVYLNGVFYSRNGKIFTWLDHISLPKDVILDGELYNSQKDTVFEDIVSVVKTEKEMDKSFISYNVFDKIDDTSFEERNRWINDNLKGLNNVSIVPTFECKLESELVSFHDDFVEQGYEGLMLKNKNGLYRENYRSPDLQKYKLFMDDEFEIVGFTDGTGIESGCVIWECQTKKKDRFSVRPRGSHESRKKLFTSADECIGKMLTVRFQNYSKGDIPRFPVGICVRDYE